MTASAAPPYTGPVWQERSHIPHVYMRDSVAMVRIAASIVAMIFLGTYFVVLLYALWLPCAYYKKRWLLRPSAGTAFPGVIALYCLTSTAWSNYPGDTFRAALELISVICCSLIIARLVRTGTLIKGITAGMCLSLIVILVTAGGIHAETALVGSLGSKNQVGANAEIGCYCAIMCWWLYRAFWKKLVLAFIPFAFCTLCLILSKSATSDLSLAAMLCVTYATHFLGKLPRSFRTTCFIAMVVAGVVVAVIGLSLNWQDLGLKAVGKNATLTGRTYLWSEGLKTGMENPILGVGYGGFWVRGTPEAEKIWYTYHILTKTGFHFHNLFINLFVETGVTGVFLWGLMYLSTCWKSVRYVLKHGATAESTFYVGIAVMYLTRAMTEVDTTGPYGVGPLLFFTVVISVATQSRQKALRRNTEGHDIRPRMTLPSEPLRRPLL